MTVRVNDQMNDCQVYGTHPVAIETGLAVYRHFVTGLQVVVRLIEHHSEVTSWEKSSPSLVPTAFELKTLAGQVVTPNRGSQVGKWPNGAFIQGERGQLALHFVRELTSL